MKDLFTYKSNIYNCKSIIARKPQRYRMTNHIVMIILNRNKVSSGSFSTSEGFPLNHSFCHLIGYACVISGLCHPLTMQHYHISYSWRQWALNDRSWHLQRWKSGLYVVNSWFFMPCHIRGLQGVMPSPTSQVSRQTLSKGAALPT